MTRIREEEEEEVSGQREGCEVRQRSFSDRINTKWLHPRGVIDGLITAGVGCMVARRDV